MASIVRADPADWFSLGQPVVQRLADFDVILMRKDPPFDSEYFYATHLLGADDAEADALIVDPFFAQVRRQRSARRLTAIWRTVSATDPEAGGRMSILRTQAPFAAGIAT